ncbi:hypothetical protein V5O48_009137 [Marasmius crinis-equi]|uniref:Uncharacterized protein n=1 Tax=Marasmius crinis-equi TaxID=585013 RepID=A0ABR3FC99_9AGAR
MLSATQKRAWDVLRDADVVSEDNVAKGLGFTRTETTNLTEESTSSSQTATTATAHVASEHNAANGLGSACTNPTSSTGRSTSSSHAAAVVPTPGSLAGEQGSKPSTPAKPPL